MTYTLTKEKYNNAAVISWFAKPYCNAKLLI